MPGLWEDKLKDVPEKLIRTLKTFPSFVSLIQCFSCFFVHQLFAHHGCTLLVKFTCVQYWLKMVRCHCYCNASIGNMYYQSSK